MTHEGLIAAYLKKRITDLGGEYRKVSWEGRANAPDLLVLFPSIHFFVETKAPGEVPRPAQNREFERLQKAGFDVYVVSTKDEIDRLIKDRLQCFTKTT